jgi:hypothetical protein
VGPGHGKITRLLTPHFDNVTLIEPNPDFVADLLDIDATIYQAFWEEVNTSQIYDLVLCSHVLYHVPVSQWGNFTTKLIEASKGLTVIAMEARGSQLNTLLNRYKQDYLGNILEYVQGEILTNDYTVHLDSKEDMHALYRFFVIENCFTLEEWQKLDREQVERQIQEDIDLLKVTGGYELTWREHLIFID